MIVKYHAAAGGMLAKRGRLRKSCQSVSHTQIRRRLRLIYSRHAWSVTPGNDYPTDREYTQTHELGDAQATRAAPIQRIRPDAQAIGTQPLGIKASGGVQYAVEQRAVARP